MEKVESFTSFLRNQPEISNVRSITDIIKQLNQNMNGDDSSFYKLPDTDEEASQYLFLYELSLGYGMDLTDQINVDRSAVRITAYVPRTTTAELQELIQGSKIGLKRMRLSFRVLLQDKLMFIL